MRRDIEFDAEDVTLRGWFYVPDGVRIPEEVARESAMMSPSIPI